MCKKGEENGSDKRNPEEKVMKNKRFTFILAISLIALTCACGAKQDQSIATVPEVETITNEAKEDAAETTADDENGASETSEMTEEAVSEKIELPAYEYPGPEEFYFVLYDYLIKELGKDYEPSDVGIPCPIIIAEDESDKNDIKIWGNFWYYTYELNGDTLETKAGGSYPGLIHIKYTDEGYEVTGMEVVGDGSDFDPTSREIFGDHYNEFIMSNANSEGNEQTRAQIIANYVAANDLPITQYQDFGWDPVKLPEENIDNFYSILD